MSQRLLVTGAGGFVAGGILWQSRHWAGVHALSRGPALLERPNLHWHAADAGDPDGIAAALRALRPEAVIHTAAIADIDYCEANPEVARRLNVDAAAAVARACAEIGARLVHCSTDTVFDGARGGYAESDPPSPVNIYGRTKAEAERAVAHLCPGAAIARVAIVIGLPVIGEGNSTLSRWMAAWRAGQRAGVPDNEIRSPIDVITLGRALLELAGNRFAGPIHLAGNDVFVRSVLAQRVAERLGYPPALVEVKNADAIPGRAPRPRDVSLDNRLAQRTLHTRMVHLDEALGRILAVDKERHA